MIFPDRPGIWGGPSATVTRQRSRHQQVVQPVFMVAVLVQTDRRTLVASVGARYRRVSDRWLGAVRAASDQYVKWRIGESALDEW